MNFNSILPLLMSINGSKKTDPKTFALLNAMSGGDKNTILSELTDNTAYAPLLKMLGNRQKEKSPPSGGLDLITKIASDDILGKLSRYFYNKKAVH